MGKTIMLSALIQTATGPEAPLPVKASTKPRQLKLNNAFRITSKPSKPPSTQGPSATLIVAPTSLLNQWAEELKRSSKEGATKVLVWHGQGRLDLEAAVQGDGDESEDEIEELDEAGEGEGEDGEGKTKSKGKGKGKGKPIRVIITSYGVLASEHAKSDKGMSQVFESKFACRITWYVELSCHLVCFKLNGYVSQCF